MTTRRKLLKTAGIGGVAAVAAPAIVKAQAPIKWRLQTYAGGALGEHVTKPMVDYVNNAANGEMEIELFYSNQIVPTGELFQALQRGTIDAVHSDDDSMASPTPLRQFGGYFPFATKHILDVPVLFDQYGLADIWRSEYEKVGVAWISAAGQDPAVVLREVEGHDVAAFFAHLQDPDARRMAAFTPENPGDALAFTARWETIRSDPFKPSPTRAYLASRSLPAVQRDAELLCCRTKPESKSS